MVVTLSSFLCVVRVLMFLLILLAGRAVARMQVECWLFQLMRNFPANCDSGRHSGRIVGVCIWSQWIYFLSVVLLKKDDLKHFPITNYALCLQPGFQLEEGVKHARMYKRKHRYNRDPCSKGAFVSDSTLSWDSGFGSVLLLFSTFPAFPQLLLSSSHVLVEPVEYPDGWSLSWL